MMVNSARRVVVVTGCSSGLGHELATQLYDRSDLNVVVTARSQSIEKLRADFVSTERFMVRELDITNEEDIYKLVNEISCTWGRVDVVINNAAVCYRGVIEHMDFNSEMLQLSTNYLGPMALIRSVLPIMREQRSGQIINISSVSGMLAMPTMGSYSASKHALEGATEALWYETRPFGIHVSLVELGFINSDSFKRVKLSNKAAMSSALGGPHSEYYKSMTPLIEKLMHVSLSSAETIAKKIIKLMARPTPPLRVTLTLDAIIFNLLKRFIPSNILNYLLYFLLPGSLKWGGKWRVGKTV